MTKLTPMMEQYFSIKNEYKDALLFFRLGDFYELFHEDAVIAARELEITLTKRDSSKQDPIPMCGVPHHSAAGYIRTLVEKGYKVAICEQVEDPKEAKGVVKREVVQLVTPGTVMEMNMLQERENNYLASLSLFQNEVYIIAYNDLSTGENFLIKITDGWDALIHELYNQPIKEVVVDPSLKRELQDDLQQQLQVTISYEEETSIQERYKNLCEALTDEAYIQTFSRLLNYIHRTQKRSLDHMQNARIIELKEYLTLDKYSKRNLELTETILRKEKYGSLLWILDKAVTAMGSRLLKKWVERPLLSKTQIENRLDVVNGLNADFMNKAQLIEALKEVYDLERLAGRVAFGNVNARDLIQLKKSLEKIPEIKLILNQFSEKKILTYAEKLLDLTELTNLLNRSIVLEPPISIKEGSIIKDGFDPELDKYRDASRNGKTWMAALEQKEKDETGIKSLKIGYNRVFGYYIEITKSNLNLIPEGRYERKQTLANAERFITPELKEKEQIILEAEEKIIDLEYDLFLRIRDEVKLYIRKIQDVALIISEIDVLQSFATVSEENNYIRPTFTENHLEIKNGRHPVIEKVMKDNSFVPNDIVLDASHNILLITGPNMSGKSTYMRQLALAIIMGQIGCFVPADVANLFIFDQIFTRIGAADDLVAGQSTFMVEMLETNHALQHATNKSLILLDEIGRGTSTYDGMALAQAIVEYIHDRIGASTLFSTHYHELTALDAKLPRLKNIHVQAEEHNGHVVFLHKVKDGAADESYGIHVAKLAKMPDELIERASFILNQLEDSSNKTALVDEQLEDAAQLSFFTEVNDQSAVKESEKMLCNSKDEEIIKELLALEVLEMTPLEALNELYRLKKKIKQ